jgi:NADH dehydrogenase FAD-containing subunit
MGCARQHLWKPRLHEVAARVLGDSEAAIQYLALARANGLSLSFGPGAWPRCDRGDDAIGRALTAQGDMLLSDRLLTYYDLVLAFGSQVHDYGIRGVRFPADPHHRDRGSLVSLGAQSTAGELPIARRRVRAF